MEYCIGERTTGGIGLLHHSSWHTRVSRPAGGVEACQVRRWAFEQLGPKAFKAVTALL